MFQYNIAILKSTLKFIKNIAGMLITQPLTAWIIMFSVEFWDVAYDRILSSTHS